MRSLAENAIWNEGWFDARDGEPLWDRAHSMYREGWLAYWRARELMRKFGGKYGWDAT